MCNLYSMTSNIEAIRALVKHLDRVSVGNLPAQKAVFPDFLAPIVRNTDLGRELAMVRWGMPTPNFVQFQKAKKRAETLTKKRGQALSDDEFKDLLSKEPDRGVTNVRNTKSKHWERWLEPRFRCVVPFTSFSEFNKDAGGDIWFAFDDDRPLAFFAGIWAPQWTSVRKVKEGTVTSDLFAFLTTEPNKEVGAIHPKAMPVILRTPEEIETWLTADWVEASKLQRSLPDGSLKIVLAGVKEDPD